MEIIIVICYTSVAFSVILTMLSLYYSFFTNKYVSLFLYGVYAATFVLGLTIALISEKVPTAMDVYQNKTTLKYDVINGEKIDSTVIFKTLE